ncbi:Uncharacterised protein [Mycobacteroides abscessus subsp. abscessus]|nr:Uncharacterised protein [Mycobacteroides abscessus subsp. abscessus]
MFLTKRKALQTAVLSSSIQTASSRQLKSMQAASAVTQAQSSTKSKQPNMYATIQVKFALLNGRKAEKHLSQALTL